MILVTGATGFLGSYLLAHLVEQGDQLRALYRDPAHISRTRSLFDHLGKQGLFDQIEWAKADITDIPSLEPVFDGIRQVYHCAAKVSFDPADEAVLRKTNIEGTANIVNMCLATGVSKLCYASSIAALGDLRPGETVITEESEWNPEQYHSDYAISKYGAEMEVWRGQQEGLDVVIVNPGVIIGYWMQREGTMKIFHTVRQGLKWKTTGSTGFVAVQDVANIMRLLMVGPMRAARFAIVSENIRYDALTGMIASCLGVPAPGRMIRPWVTSLLYKLDWFIAAIIRSRRQLPRSIATSLHATEAYSNKHILSVLPYQFTPVTEAVKVTCSALRSDVS